MEHLPMSSTGLSTAPYFVSSHRPWWMGTHVISPILLIRKERLRGSHRRKWLRRAGDSGPGFYALQRVKKEGRTLSLPRTEGWI